MAIQIPTRPRHQSELALKRSSALVGTRHEVAAHAGCGAVDPCSGGRLLTAEERHALIRTVVSSMAIEGVYVPHDMAQHALEISLAELATGKRRLGQQAN